MNVEAQLVEIADLSQHGATERDIETEIVQVFKTIGWPRLQINQDVPVSDKAEDRVDVLLKLDNRPIVIVELKRNGRGRNSEGQVQRYCSLLRPSPKFAVLTDGTRWTIYFAGLNTIVPIAEHVVPQDAKEIERFLTLISPEPLKRMEDSRLFDFVSLIEQSLAGLSVDGRRSMQRHLVTTIRAVILSCSEPLAAPITNAQASVELTKQQSSTEDGVQPISISEIGSKQYDANRPPDLSYTTMSGKIGYQSITKWSELVHTSIRVAVQYGCSISDLQRVSGLNMREGVYKTTNGFTHVIGTNLSVQGMDANRAWPAALKMAQLAKCEIEARFQWRDKQAVLPEYRGQQGIMRWTPSGK